MVNALKLSIIYMTILNLVFFIMISNQLFFLYGRMPYGNQQMYNKVFSQWEINRHKSKHNKYIICSREPFYKSRVVFRDNSKFIWQKSLLLIIDVKRLMRVIAL
jgi:hypothetical protein